MEKYSHFIILGAQDRAVNQKYLDFRVYFHLEIPFQGVHSNHNESLFNSTYFINVYIA